MSLQAIAYQGRADHAWPPSGDGWAEVPYHHDASVREHAQTVMLGQLPPYHYADEAMASGLYRFFAFETPIGKAVGALKFIGEGAARDLLLGQSPSDVYASTEAWIATPTDTGGLATDTGGAVPADNSAITGTGGGGGVVVTPVNYPTLAAAASAMNAALAAHGYVRTDQPIYAGFQIKAGDLTVDAFPGTHTMNRLRNVLPAGTMANVRVYPWLATTPGGATGQAAYDGTNAPTWAQWTGAAGTAPAVARAGMGSGALVAGVVGTLVVVGAVIAKSAGAI